MSPYDYFDMRIAQIHGLNRAGGSNMDIRHEEFMAMADAFLGPDYDKGKLQQVEQLQLELHAHQARLAADFQSRQLDEQAFVDESNRLSAFIAARCEAILGAADFHKLFGAAAADLNSYIDANAFLQAV